MFVRSAAFSLAALALAVTGCAARSAPPSDPSKASPSDHTTSEWRDVGWVSLGIGAAAGAVALGTGYVMLHDASVRDSNCTNKACNAQGLDANSQLKSIQDWNTGLWVAAAVGLGVGAFLVITHPAGGSGEKKDAGTTAIGVSPSGLTLRGSF